MKQNTGKWEVSLATVLAISVFAISGQAQIVINEFMAANDTTLADEAGQFDDWVELYNAGTTTVRLAGWHLTDDFSKTEKWAFPDTTLPPGTFLLVWCDNDPEDGPLHATFKLDADGEQIAVVNPSSVVVDSLTFGTQRSDISYGRYPDGGQDWRSFTSPTPGRSNMGTSSVEVRANQRLVPTTVRLNVWPNPVKPGAQRLHVRVDGTKFSAAVVTVYNALGRHVLTRILSLGGRKGVVDRSLDLAALPAGVYLLRFQDGIFSGVAKITVLP